MRYNTDDDLLEAYPNGAWRELRFKEPNPRSGITQQNPGNGDATETVFGPLASGDADFPVPASKMPPGISRECFPNINNKLHT